MRRICLYLTIGLFFVAPANAQHSSWTENVKFKGDFRYRHEMIDKEGKDTRNRHRIRARFEVLANVNQTTKVGLQLATGSDNPVSTNQTLDNSFSTKNLMLDLAYLEMKLQTIEGLSIKGGKFKNPFFKPGKSELIWDSDYNPEGGVAAFRRDLHNISITVITAGFWIEERSSDDDSWMVAGQCLLKYNLNDIKSSITAGASFFNYVNTIGFEPFFDAHDPAGNTVDTAGLYVNDYELVELFTEATHKLGNIPVVLMGDYVTNTSADNNCNGWLIGISVGKVKKPGSWSCRYIYRELGKDAVVGMFTDSDFRGGGTDAKGHEIGGAFQIAKNNALKLTYFMNKIGLDQNESDFKRLQVDLQLKF